MSNVKKVIRKELSGVRQEVSNRAAGYILTAFGLVAGLAWNDAIKALIELYFPASGQGVWAKFAYAILLTLVAVLISLYLVRFLKKEKDDNVEKTRKK